MYVDEWEFDIQKNPMYVCFKRRLKTQFLMKNYVFEILKKTAKLH